MSYTWIPWTVAFLAPLSMGFSRQAYWRGLPCPPPGDLPDWGMEPASLMPPALVGTFFTTSTTWEAHWKDTPHIYEVTKNWDRNSAGYHSEPGLKYSREGMRRNEQLGSDECNESQWLV